MLSDAKCPYASGVESSLAERCRRTHGRIPRFIKYRQRSRQIKPEEMLHKSDVNFHKGVTQGLSEPTCVSVHTYCFPPNKHFTCFTTACLCGNSFLQTWRAKAWSLTTGLVPRIWCSHCHDRPQSLAGNQRPALRSCRLRPPEISNSLFYLLPNTRSCAWCTARPNKPKHQSLEHRKVHCRASQREQVAPA